LFEYSCRETIIDVFLVGHEPPHPLKTKLNEGGINYKAGDVVTIYDPIINEITNSVELPDDLNIEVDHFNEKIIKKLYISGL